MSGTDEISNECCAANGQVYRAQNLRSIRMMGKEALNAIDRSLIQNHDGDLAALAPGVLPPLNAILRAGEALEEASSQVLDRAQFLEDLARLRQDATLLIEMVQGTTAGLAGQGLGLIGISDHRSESSSGSLTAVPSRLDR